MFGAVLQNHRPPWWPLVVLFGLGILTRIPFTGAIVRPGDAGHFMLAVEHFDVRLQQPQMPGMFVVFIYLARGFNLFLQDPHTSLIAVNILAAGVAAAFLYLVGRDWFNARVGWTAGLLMLSSPLIWHRAEIALSHVTEFCWILMIDYAAYRAGLGQRKFLLLLGFLMGCAGGIRPSAPFFLLPLALFAAYRGWRVKGFGLRDVAIALFCGGLGIALWFVPLIYTSGGWQDYWNLVQAWLPIHAERTDADSIVKVIDNLLVFIKALLYVVGLAILPMLWAIAQNRFAWVRQPWPRAWTGQCLVLSILPGMLFFLLVHLRRQDQTFTVMPSFVLMAGWCLVALGDRWHDRDRRAPKLLIAAVLSVNSLFFLLGPDGVPTLRELQAYDREFKASIEYIHANFAPETTAILAHSYYFRLPDIYFPEYQEPQLSLRVNDEPLPLNSQVRTLVLLGQKVYRKPGQDDAFQPVALPGPSTLRYRTWAQDETPWVTQSGIEIRAAN